MPDERNYEIPDDTRVLVVTPNYTNWVTAETHINHVETVSMWKKWGLKTNWMIIGRTFVQFARSQGVQAMLDGGFTHLFFVDDDAIIDPHLLPKYVQHDKHIMITPYPMRKSPFQIGILSSVSYYCRDCRHRWECPGDVTPPPTLPCPECSKTTPRDYHEHAMYRNFTTKDLNQGLVQVDGGGTHAMLIKREVFTKSYGFPKPRRGEQLSDDNRSYPEKALDVIHEFQDMSDDPKKRQLFDHYLGDVPDQSMSFEEEWKIDQKPFFVMPKVGTEDMLYCGTDGIVYGDFNDISVPSMEAITHTGRKEAITQFHKREYSGEIVCVKPLYTEAIRLTPNHPVFTSVTSRRWTDAGELKESDKLFFPKPRLNDYTPVLDMTQYAAGAFVGDDGIQFKRTTTKASKAPVSVKMTSDLAWLFGFYVAEGNCSKNFVCFSHNAETEQAHVGRIQSVCREAFGISNFDYQRNGNSGQLRFTNTVLARFFTESFGKGAGKKRFPKWISDNLRFSGAALRGLWDGDGMLGHTQGSILTTTSRALAHQVKNLLAANGILASIRVVEKALPRHTIYTVRPLAAYRKLFGELVGIELPDKMTSNKEKALYTKRANGIEGWWIPIESITRELFEGTVYNAGVQNANSYVLNGVAVHNCYRARMKGFEVWCDTDEFAAHIGFAPVITREFTESMEKMGTQPPQKEGAIGLALIGDHARNHNVMYRDAETTLA